MSDFWSVAVDAPLSEPLTYQAPAELKAQLHRGLLVDVPLGKRSVKGLLLSPSVPSAEPEFVIKSIQSVDAEYQALPESFLKWIEWMAHY